MADQPTPKGITKIAVSGFKSLRDRSEIEVRPLTILAGANSSGKSSIMQPLLLMKQTLEAAADLGTFNLDGPNASFTSTEQFLSDFHEAQTPDLRGFDVTIDLTQNEFYISYQPKFDIENLHVHEIRYENDEEDIKISLRLDSKHEEILAQLPPQLDELRVATEGISTSKFYWGAAKNRCFLSLSLFSEDDNLPLSGDFSLKFFPISSLSRALLEIIHVPALRETPKRSYTLHSIRGNQFKGTFEPYVPGILSEWGSHHSHQLQLLVNALSVQLDIVHGIAFVPINKREAEIRVGRTKKSNEKDTVSIADVGFGVSQVLPVLVALLVAEPGQLVYIEQPELHLHPRAQHKLAQVLADAANRGVRVVIETHSELLLRGVQTVVANGTLAPDKVILHWFKREDDGASKIDSRELDAQGAYGDWPEDFAEVDFAADREYLDAVAAQREKAK